MRELEVVIAGEKFAHLLYHFVLTYSNWVGIDLPKRELRGSNSGMQTAFWRWRCSDRAPHR